MGWCTIYYLSQQALSELSGSRYRRLCQYLGLDPAGAVVKITCDVCQNYWVDLGRLERVSGKRARCTHVLLCDLHLFVTPSLADEDRPFINQVIREDLPASAVNSDNEEFVTAACCNDHCCEDHCSCDQGDGSDGADADDDGNNNDPDVFVSSGVWDDV